MYPALRCNAEALRQALIAAEFRDQYTLRSIRQLAEVIASPRTTPERRNSAIAEQATFLAEHHALVQEEYSLTQAIARCQPLNIPRVPMTLRGFGATYPLDGSSDAGLKSLQEQLVRLGFLARADGYWNWDTYAALGFANRYLQTIGVTVPDGSVVHAASNTYALSDAYVHALSVAPIPPSSTIGLWKNIPHKQWLGVDVTTWRNVVTGVFVVSSMVTITSAGVWAYRKWKKRRR